MLSRARRGACETVAGAALWRCRCEIVAGAALCGWRCILCIWVCVCVAGAAFCECVFKGLRPGKEIPEKFDAKHKWKIESLPFGTTSDGLRDWAVSIGWAIKPLKFLGPRAAILLSTTTEGILSINGTPILLRALDTKKKNAGSLIAGQHRYRLAADERSMGKKAPPQQRRMIRGRLCRAADQSKAYRTGQLNNS